MATTFKVAVVPNKDLNPDEIKTKDNIILLFNNTSLGLHLTKEIDLENNRLFIELKGYKIETIENSG